MDVDQHVGAVYRVVAVPVYTPKQLAEHKQIVLEFDIQVGPNYRHE